MKNLIVSWRQEGKNGLEGDDLVDKAARDGFALFWGATALPVEEALPYF